MHIARNSAGWNDEPAKVFSQRLWIGVTLLTVVALAIAATFWIFEHPYGTNWDEARYINRAYRDVAFFRQNGLSGMLGVLVGEDRTRPPAYRILVLPITLLTGANPYLLRLLSLASLGVTLWFTYQVGKRIAGVTAGAFAVAFLALCPIVVAPGMRFYVDFPLYLAIALFLYFLLRDWNQPQPTRNWIGLGIALGLGAMAKPPFVFVAAPALGFVLLLLWRNLITAPKLSSLIKACGLATLIALPWWVFNFKPALAKAFKSGGFVRHSLGPKGSPEALSNWLYMFMQTMLGPALALLLLGILVTAIILLVQRQLRLETAQWTAIALCLVASLPMLLTSAFATNQNPRLVAPALLPLAIGVGALAALTGWTTSRWLAAAAVTVMVFQLVVMVSPTPGEPRYQEGDVASKGLLWGNPTNVMRREELWDWDQLRRLTRDRQIDKPLIAYLGGGSGLSAPELGSPWVVANEEAEVRWIWRYEDGAIDWNKVLDVVKASNVVVTALDVVGYSPNKTDIDNQHNLELVQRLKQMSEFAQPIEIKMGRFDRDTVIVFLRKPGTPMTTPPIPKLDLY